MTPNCLPDRRLGWRCASKQRKPSVGGPRRTGKNDFSKGPPIVVLRTIKHFHSKNPKVLIFDWRSSRTSFVVFLASPSRAQYSADGAALGGAMRRARVSATIIFVGALLLGCSAATGAHEARSAAAGSDTTCTD